MPASIAFTMPSESSTLELQKTDRWYPLNASAFSSLIGGAFTGAGISKLNDAFFKQFHYSVPLQSSSKLLLEQMKKQNKLAVVKSGFQAVLLSPLIEEAVFRGGIYSEQKKQTTTFYQNPRDYWKDAAKNISLNAALFSAMHFDRKMGIKSSMKLMPSLFLFGVAYGCLAELTGNLWAPTAAHSITNAIAFKKLTQLAKK